MVNSHSFVCGEFVEGLILGLWNVGVARERCRKQIHAGLPMSGAPYGMLIATTHAQLDSASYQPEPLGFHGLQEQQQEIEWR
jgi:hypothetical protein